MKSLKKSQILLIVTSVLILLGCIGITAYLLFSNYQNVRLFKQAQSNFQRGDADSLNLAEAQLQQLIRSDHDSEAAYIMLAAIAEKRKTYPEQVYYSYMAHRLNPLSDDNKANYIKSLCFARYFDRLENFLSQQYDLPDNWNQLLLYSAGRNGNFNKYKAQLARRDNDNSIGELAFLLFRYKHLNTEQKLRALKNIKGNEFVKQELLAAAAELHLANADFDNAEKVLLDAYALNPYAFAPVLGRFYANIRTLGQALPYFEKHLAIYHDPVIALQTAEIYCLLKRTSEIASLRAGYQTDSGNSAMLLCYYFDALIALAENNMTELKELLLPLRQNINTPLARFMIFCNDLQDKNLAAIHTSYTALLAGRNYADLHSRADDLLSEFLKENPARFHGKEEQLLPLATRLYSRKKEAFTAKLILLTQKRKNSIDAALLKDALKSFKHDHGVIKIAIEYFLHANDTAAAKKLISVYKQNFPGKTADMQRYEIFLALQNKDFDQASELFRRNFAPEFRLEYWNFASSTMREKDLQFLSKDKLYEPFCQALLLLKKGNRTEACDLLEKSPGTVPQDLLFFAARILAENGRNQAALEKYALFPANTPYKLDILLNTAELFAENGNIKRALELSAQAHALAPDRPETQLCYADKLYQNGNLTKIPDVVRFSSAAPFRKKLESLWIAGMRQRIKMCDLHNQREKAREYCRQLLTVVPYDNIALECLKQLNKMPQ